MLLAACSRDGDGDGDGDGGAVRRREVARVNAQVDAVPEGVKVSSVPPQCIQYEVTGGSYGKTRYQVEVMLQNRGGAVFTGPEGTKVFYRVVVDASGQRYDGWAGFQDPREVNGLAVLHADDIAKYGTTSLQPDGFAGLQEVPAGMTGCTITVRRADQERSTVPDARPLRQLAPVVQDVDATTRPIDEA